MANREFYMADPWKTSTYNVLFMNDLYPKERGMRRVGGIPSEAQDMRRSSGWLAVVC